MRTEKYTAHHWEFWEENGLFICYDNRDGDVIGSFDPMTLGIPLYLDELVSMLIDMDEENAYDWICGYIEWY